MENARRHLSGTAYAVPVLNGSGVNLFATIRSGVRRRAIGTPSY
jgi:hypothetical protein